MLKAGLRNLLHDDVPNNQHTSSNKELVPSEKPFPSIITWRGIKAFILPLTMRSAR